MLPWRPFPRPGLMSEMVHGALALAAWPPSLHGAHWTGRHRLPRPPAFPASPLSQKENVPQIPLECLPLETSGRCGLRNVAIRGSKGTSWVALPEAPMSLGPGEGGLCGQHTPGLTNPELGVSMGAVETKQRQPHLPPPTCRLVTCSPRRVPGGRAILQQLTLVQPSSNPQSL